MRKQKEAAAGGRSANEEEAGPWAWTWGKAGRWTDKISWASFATNLGGLLLACFWRCPGGWAGRPMRSVAFGAYGLLPRYLLVPVGNENNRCCRSSSGRAYVALVNLVPFLRYFPSVNGSQEMARCISGRELAVTCSQRTFSSSSARPK